MFFSCDTLYWLHIEGQPGKCKDLIQADSFCITIVFYYFTFGACGKKKCNALVWKEYYCTKWFALDVSLELHSMKRMYRIDSCKGFTPNLAAQSSGGGGEKILSEFRCLDIERTDRQIFACCLFPRAATRWQELRVDLWCNATSGDTGCAQVACCVGTILTKRFRPVYRLHLIIIVKNNCGPYMSLYGICACIMYNCP